MSGPGATRHWRNQRLSAMALVPLGIWFVFALLSQPDLSHASIAAWLASPWQAGLMLAFGWMFQWGGGLGGPIAAHFLINLINLRQIASDAISATRLDALPKKGSRQTTLDRRMSSSTGMFQAWSSCSRH